MARAPFRGRSPFFIPSLFEFPPERGRRRAAPLRGHTRHAGTTEAVQDHIARLGVVKNGRDDCPMRHFGVIAMSPVERIGLAFADIDCERLAVIGFRRVVGTTMTFDELGQKRVGAGGVIRRVRQPKDVLVLANREVGPLPKFGELHL